MIEELLTWAARGGVGAVGIDAALDKLVEGVLEQLPALTEIATATLVREVCAALGR